MCERGKATCQWPLSECQVYLGLGELVSTPKPNMEQRFSQTYRSVPQSSKHVALAVNKKCGFTLPSMESYQFPLCFYCPNVPWKKSGRVSYNFKRLMCPEQLGGRREYKWNKWTDSILWALSTLNMYKLYSTFSCNVIQEGIYSNMNHEEFPLHYVVKHCFEPFKSETDYYLLPFQVVLLVQENQCPQLGLVHPYEKETHP